MRFSVSEIQLYQRCRRSWDLQSQNRMGLVPAMGAPKPLWVGSMFHKVLDLQASGLTLKRAMGETLKTEFARYVDDYTTSVGVAPSPEETERFWEAGGEAVQTLEAYFGHYGTSSPLGEDFQYVATEVTAEVAIPRTRNFLILTMDGIARQLSTGLLYLVEHKTFSQQPQLEKLYTDWQMSAYLWGAEMIFSSETFQGVIYDGISKKPGAWNRFVRHNITMPRALLLQTEQTLIHVTREMANPRTEIFPNFTWMGCFDCQVRDICRSMSFGEDTEFLVRTYYRRGSGHATVRRLDNPREEVRSIADLERARRKGTGVFQAPLPQLTEAV